MIAGLVIVFLGVPVTERRDDSRSMRLSARLLAALGAIALCLGNVGRIPSAALGGRSTPLVVADLVVASVWGFLLFAVVLGRGRIVIDDVMSATLAFLVAATVSTGLAFTRYNLGSRTAPASPRFSFGGSPTSGGIRSSCGA